MREYGKVSPAFWTGETGRRIVEAGQEAVIVSLYLMTSPHANMLGIYYLPIPYISHDTGLSTQGASKGLQRVCEAGMCGYDDRKQVVWVYEMARFQVEDHLKDGDKRVLWVRKEYEKLPKCLFLGDFFDKYASSFHLINRRGVEAPSIPLDKPHRSQEQEQEQEQDIEQEKRTTSCSEVYDHSERNVVMSIPLNIKDTFFEIMQKDIEGWIESFPAVDVMGELRKCRQWNLDNPQKRKTKAGIRGHISSWLGKRQDEGPKRSKTISPQVSVKDVQFLQNDAIARVLNEDDRRKSQQPGPYGREEGCLLVESQVPFAEKQRALGQN